MPIGTAIGAGLGLAGSIGGALITSDASRRASNAQQSALQTAMAKLQPFMDAGRSALDPLTKLLTPGSNMTEVLSQIPGFQFAQDWGQKAVRNQGTTLGLGGNVLSAGANYATGLAQNSYGSIVNALQNLANMGANAGSGVASIAGNVGNAAASGILGSANALSSGLSNGANSVGNAFLLNGLTSKLSPGASGNGIYSGPGSAGPNGSTWQPDPMGGYSPGYAEGGRPTPGEPAIVGEEGPEVFVPDQPGTIIPNPKTNSGALDALRFVAPRTADLMQGKQAPTTALPEYGKVPTDDPFGDALREELMLGASGVAGGGAGSLVPRAAAMASRVGGMARNLPMLDIAAGAVPTASAASAVSSMAPLTGTAHAADDPRAARIFHLESAIADGEKQLQTLSTKNMQSTAARTAVQQPILDRIKGYHEEVRSLRDALTKEYADEQREKAIEAKKKKMSEASFRERFPSIADAIPGVTPAVAALSGYGFGRYFRGGREAAASSWQESIDRARNALSSGPVTPATRNALTAELNARKNIGLPGKAGLIAAAGSGGLEGVIGQAAPTLWESETLPIGSPNQLRAAENLSDPYWWMSRVAPATGLGIAGATIGGAKGMTRGGAPVLAPAAETEGILAALASKGGARRAPAKKKTR